MKTSPTLILRQAHRKTLWEGPLWAVSGGLAFDVISSRLGADAPLRIAISGAAIAVAILLRFGRRQTLNDTARVLDARARSKNRFEALAEVVDRADPLASALRAEATQCLSGLSLPRPYGWYSAFALIALLLSIRILAPPPGPALSLPKAGAGSRTITGQAESIPAEPSKPDPIPSASLRWLSPEASIQAVPDETIPLEAEGVSTAGLDRLLLHVSVNGELRLPIPEPGVLEAGKTSVSVDLQLGRFQTKANQLVSYYLSAERIVPKEKAATPAWPEVISPLQWVKIRGLFTAFGSAAPPALGPAVSSGRLSSALAEIEKVEERILAKTFTLAHSAPSPDPSKVRSSLEQLAAEQARISEQIKDLIASAGANELAPEIRKQLVEIQEISERAAASLAAQDLAGATKAVEKTLSGLLPAERSAAEDAAKAAPPDLNRKTAAAGAEAPPAMRISVAQLSQFASTQRSLADSLVKGNSQSGVFAQQYGLARDLARAGAGSGLPADITAKIQAAAAEAEVAAGQLNAGDPVAAKEPAERAAMDLNQAVKGLSSDAHSRATATLATVQRLLIRAAGAVKSPEKSALGAAKALGLTQAARKLLRGKTQQLQSVADQQAVAQEAKDMRSDKKQSDDADSRAAEQKAVHSLGAPPGLDDNAQELLDLDGDIVKSKIESDLQKLIDAGSKARPEDEDAAARKLLELAKKSAGRLSMLGTPETVASEALKNLQADRAAAKNASNVGQTDLENIAVDATAEIQLAEKAAEQAAQAPGLGVNRAGGSNPGSGAGSASGSNAGSEPSRGQLSSGGGAPPAGKYSGPNAGSASNGTPAEDTLPANSGVSAKSGSSPILHKGEPGDGDGSPRFSSSSLLNSVQKRDLSGDVAPNASPDDLGTGGRIKPGESSARAPNLNPLEFHFGPGPATPASRFAQSTVGKQMSAAEVLSQRIGDAILRLQTYGPAAPRAETLATADPSQAPPDYQAAVADYFEALAKASSAEAPASP